MDLQVTRNLEQFFRLLNRWPVHLEDRIECHWTPYGILLESVDDRLLMTSWLLEPKVTQLQPWLSRWHPEAFMGLPQRVFMVKSRLMISCLCPSFSQAHDWYHLCLMQQKFLSKVITGGQL
ncbi:hypothetical protein Sps_00987 [Shewanella psychrophila]|uniref:Uncharacterized protein n=1 Tax=Shewanella psychrophila TaxID=225848 RepID=A0A1S6HKW6_9GAMM|nr:type III secretion apparatus [Shewanella psychrophila]AQS36176.1 hypothetical protein Sps_00987 [Shewanella psychrophila]